MQKAETKMRVGVDLGGSKTEIAALDESGTTVWRERAATPRGYGQVLQTVVDLVRRAEERFGAVTRVGICTPGSISPATGLLKNSNLVSLNGRSIDRDLGRLLSRPVRVANDADCFALSEAVDGAGKGARILFAVILGTGTGGGVVVDGRLLTGPNAIAGEWGHNPLPWAEGDELGGARCYCGRRGCIETFLSGPALAGDYWAATGRGLPPEEITRLAEGGDPAAAAALGRYRDRLARALASVINVLDPHAVVLGGGLSGIESLYREVPALWGRYVFSDTVETRLLRAHHGDSSGVRGAAWL